MSVYLDIKSLYPHLKVNWNVLMCKICIVRRLIVDIFPWCNANFLPFPSGTLVARRMGNGSIQEIQERSFKWDLRVEYICKTERVAKQSKGWHTDMKNLPSSQPSLPSARLSCVSPKLSPRPERSEEVQKWVDDGSVLSYNRVAKGVNWHTKLRINSVTD